MASVRIINLGFETLRILVRYLTPFIGENDALQLGEDLIDLARENLEKYPLKCPVCNEMEQIGVTDYRQLTVEKNYKILYRHDESNDEVNIMAFMRQRQSAQDLLIQYTLMDH
jgi:hypothetical protein